MRLEFRVRLLSEDGEKFFGEGPYRLLRGVERLGSLRAAAAELGMAYSKAARIIGRAEQTLGAPLTEKRIGGPDGGGSRLTPLARELLERYEALRADCEAAAQASFARRFGDLLPTAEDSHPRAGDTPALATEGMPRAADSPRASEGRTAPAEERLPLSGEASPVALGCVVLAAGQARRFGGGKLLADLGGRPVLAHMLDALPRECFCRIVAVTSDPAVSALCRGLGLPVREYPGGPLSESIREGLAEMDGTDGCVFVNGDQPLLRPGSLRRLAAAFAREPGCAHRLAHGGTAASPVAIPASAYPALRDLTGESGGMAALRAGSWKIRTVEAEDPSELWDVDEPAGLAAISLRAGGACSHIPAGVGGADGHLPAGLERRTSGPTD